MFQFFADLGEYLLLVFFNWIAYMSAFPLILDEIVKWCSPRWSEWLEEHFSRRRRRKFEIALMILGFIIANFMAFEGERDEKRQAQTEKDAALKQAYAMSPAGQLEEIKKLRGDIQSEKLAFSEIELKQQREIEGLQESDSILAPRRITDDQKRSFIDALKTKIKGPVAVIALSNSAEATDFANQMRELLNDAGYTDPDNKTVKFESASMNLDPGTHPAESYIAELPEDKQTCLWGGPIQVELTKMGIPANGTIDGGKALGLKPGEIAFVVLGK